MRSFLLALLLTSCSSLFFSACTPTTSDPTANHSVLPDSTTLPLPLAERQVAGMPVVLVVRTVVAPVYERPVFSAPVIATYYKDDSLIFTNRVTEALDEQQLEGLTYREPWLRIILPNQEMAWIHGAHISFDSKAQPELAQLVLQQRAKALFGKALALQMSIYQQEAPKTRSLPGFRALYTRAQNIKDSLEFFLANYAHAPQSSPDTDFFWINQLLDGLLLHYVPEQKKHYLFRDLTYWKELTFQTPAPEDDAFLDLLLACYPADSIAYYYYGWQLPLDDQTLCSLLGSGIHSDVLVKLDSALDSTGYFRPEILQLKTALLNDITTTSRFWMPLPAVQQELDSILQKNYAFLEVGDRVALRTKRAFLDAPQAHGLVLNLFEGG